MTAIEFLKSKGINRATCYTDGHTYYIKDLVELLDEYAQQQLKILNMPVVNVRYLLIEWINGNPVIDGCLHFNTKDKCLEYWEQLPKMAGVTYTICESHNAR